MIHMSHSKAEEGISSWVCACAAPADDDVSVCMRIFRGHQQRQRAKREGESEIDRTTACRRGERTPHSSLCACGCGCGRLSSDTLSPYPRQLPHCCLDTLPGRYPVTRLPQNPWAVCVCGVTHHDPLLCMFRSPVEAIECGSARWARAPISRFHSSPVSSQEGGHTILQPLQFLKSNGRCSTFFIVEDEAKLSAGAMHVCAAHAGTRTRPVAPNTRDQALTVTSVACGATGRSGPRTPTPQEVNPPTRAHERGDDDPGRPGAEAVGGCPIWPSACRARAPSPIARRPCFGASARANTSAADRIAVLLPFSGGARERIQLGAHCFSFTNESINTCSRKG